MANKCLWLLVAAASVALLLIHGHRRRRSLRAAKRTAAISELRTLASDMRTLASEMRSPPPPPLVSPPPPLTSPPPPPPLASSPPPRDSYHADPSCHPTQHAGFNGGSLNWGMSFKVYTAQECCDACKAHARTCVPGSGGTVYFRRITWEGKAVDERCAGSMNSNEHGSAKAQPCNIFTYCPTPLAAGGLCWSNDVWNHTYGECWLKHQPRPERPEAGAYGAYPDGYRRKHRTAPELVQWMSGSLATTPTITVDGPKWHW